MISHETLLKATVVGTLTAAVLSIPIFVDLDSSEHFDSEAPPVEEVYEPARIHSMPLPEARTQNRDEYRLSASELAMQVEALRAPEARLRAKKLTVTNLKERTQEAI